MTPFRQAQLLLTVAIITGLAACLGACTAPPLRDATYVLKPRQSLDLARGLTLTYDSFSDSRCPANVQCIWAGRLAFRFIVQDKDGSEEFTLGPDQPLAAPAALHGAQVALDLGGIPPARIAVARPQDLFPVTLKISAAHPPSANLPPRP